MRASRWLASLACCCCVAREARACNRSDTSLCCNYADALYAAAGMGDEWCAIQPGVYEGSEFMIEYEGQTLSVTCPDGCGPGDAIDLEIPAAPGGGDGSSGEAPPMQVEVVVPDGCYPGMEFTVDFDGRTFLFRILENDQLVKFDQTRAYVKYKSDYLIGNGYSFWIKDGAN